MQKKHMERCLFTLLVLLIFALTILGLYRVTKHSPLRLPRPPYQPCPPRNPPPMIRLRPPRPHPTPYRRRRPHRPTAWIPMLCKA